MLRRCRLCASDSQQVADGGSAFVGVLEVGVELLGEPLFGVGGEQV
jgi:hypothetical protein